MNLKWFTYGRKYAGKGYSKQHRGFMQQSNIQKHTESKLGRERVGSGLQGSGPVRFKPGSVHRRTEPVSMCIKGFWVFFYSFFTKTSFSLLPLFRSLSLSLKKFWKNFEQNGEGSSPPANMWTPARWLPANRRRRRRAGEMKTAKSNFFYTFKYPFLSL